MLRVVTDLYWLSKEAVENTGLHYKVRKTSVGMADINDSGLREGQNLMLLGASFHLHFLCVFVFCSGSTNRSLWQWLQPMVDGLSKPHHNSSYYHHSWFTMCKSRSYSQELLLHSTAKYAMQQLQQKCGGGSKPTPEWGLRKAGQAQPAIPWSALSAKIWKALEATLSNPDTDCTKHRNCTKKQHQHGLRCFTIWTGGGGHG